MAETVARLKAAAESEAAELCGESWNLLSANSAGIGRGTVRSAG